jgi:tetratricopeptide (TPR) repeat protein
MRKEIAATLVAFVFAAGLGVGYTARLKPAPAMYHAKDKQEAAKALLGVALVQAGKGSWERIGVGRVYYLGGFKAEGQKIFDDVLGHDPDPGDVFRIARVYREAGEWDRAKQVFDRYLIDNPREPKDLAEVGAYYMLQGDRDGAERLFDRSFAADGDEVWATLHAAGAYLGVAPQP